jgi:hypothetical protein
MNPDLQEVIDDVTEATTIAESTLTFVNGVPALIDAAVKAAVGLGATAAELAPVAQLGKDLKAKSEAIQAAILANTPAAPTT